MDMGTSATAGRPRAFDQDTVLERALDLFWRRGYRNTTTRDLESALELSQSSLYNAFGSKSGLMEAALDRYEDMTGVSLLDPLTNSSDGLDAVDRFLDDLAHWVTHDGRSGCMLINLMVEDGGASSSVTKRAAAYRRRVRDALRDALARDIGESAEQRADLLFGVVLGINVAARGGAPRAELNRLVASAHHIVDSWRQAA